MLLMLNLESENHYHEGAYDRHNNDEEIIDHFLIFASTSVITTVVSSVVVGRDNTDNTSKSFVVLIAVTSVSINTSIIHYYYHDTNTLFIFLLLQFNHTFEVEEHVSMLKNNHHQAMNTMVNFGCFSKSNYWQHSNRHHTESGQVQVNIIELIFCTMSTIGAIRTDHIKIRFMNN